MSKTPKDFSEALVLVLEALSLHVDQLRDLDTRLSVIERAMQVTRQARDQRVGEETV